MELAISIFLLASLIMFAILAGIKALVNLFNQRVEKKVNEIINGNRSNGKHKHN